MDAKRLMFGLAVVFGVAGLAFIVKSDFFFGNGTFYENNFGAIRWISIVFMVMGGVFWAVSYGLTGRTPKIDPEPALEKREPPK